MVTWWRSYSEGARPEAALPSVGAGHRVGDGGCQGRCGAGGDEGGVVVVTIGGDAAGLEVWPVGWTRAILAQERFTSTSGDVKRLLRRPSSGSFLRFGSSLWPALVSWFGHG